MANRTELAEELERLRIEVEKLKADKSIKTDTLDSEQVSDPKPETTDTSSVPPTDQEIEAQLTQILEPYGIDTAEAQELVGRFRVELENLPQERPLLALFGAFTLGLMVGRLTK